MNDTSESTDLIERPRGGVDDSSITRSRYALARTRGAGRFVVAVVVLEVLADVIATVLLTMVAVASGGFNLRGAPEALGWVLSVLVGRVNLLEVGSLPAVDVAVVVASYVVASVVVAVAVRRWSR